MKLLKLYATCEKSSVAALALIVTTGAYGIVNIVSFYFFIYLQIFMHVIPFSQQTGNVK